MPGSGTRSLLACFTLALACGDTNAGSTTAGSTSTATTSTTSTTTSTASTGTDPGSTGTPPTSSASASAGSSSGETPTTGSVDTTSTSTTATTGNATTVDPSSTTTNEPGTSSSSSSSTTTSGGNGQPPPPPTMPVGCDSCECCDPWPIAWAAVPEATHYVVRWKCSINPEQVHDVGNTTKVADVCNDIEMCNGMCVFTVGYIKVQACNDDGCSALVDVPGAPITCGGGCCC
jgi:hypothetical protein